MNISKTSVFHPFLFALFPILMIYVHNIYMVPLNDTVFPILMVLIYSIIIIFISKLIFKSWKKAGIITSIIIAMTFSYGHIYTQIGGLSLGGFVIGRHRYFVFVYIIPLLISSYYIFRTKRKLDNATKISNTIAISLMLLITVNLGLYIFDTENIAIQNTLEEPKNERFFEKEKISQHLVNPSIKPDVYWIMLDGYGGYESLKKELGFDNKEFLNSLENKGFFVIENSHSNHPQTLLSISTTLNMKSFTYMTDELGKDSPDWIPMIDFVIDNEVMRNFKSLEYTVINFPRPTYDQKADVTLCKSDSLIPNNELMAVISKISIFEHLTYAFQQQEQRELILCTFNELSQVRNEFVGPIFVFAHMIIPHPPYLFGPNGEQILYKPYHDDDEIDAERYLGTLQYANKRILEIVDNLQKQDNQPIIIISSDHGSDFNNFDWDNPTDDMIRQRASNLGALYFPDGGNEYLYDEITPINFFRVLFNVYFNGTYPILEDKIYWSSYSKPYDFRDVTELVGEK